MYHGKLLTCPKLKGLFQTNNTWAGIELIAKAVFVVDCIHRRTLEPRTLSFKKPKQNKNTHTHKKNNTHFRSYELNPHDPIKSSKYTRKNNGV